jgi:hypothetical protein
MFVYAVLKCIPNCTGSFDYAIFFSFNSAKKFIKQDIEKDSATKHLLFNYEVCALESGKLWRKQACKYCTYKDGRWSAWGKETMQDSQKYYERYLDRKAKTTKGVE